MKKITFPVEEKSQGPETNNLQEALFLLLERKSFLKDNEAGRHELSLAIRNEQTKKIFGSATRKLISIFQKERHLKDTGTVDEPTAEALNALLREFDVFDEKVNDWSEIIKELNAQKQTLNAINHGTDYLKSIEEKIGSTSKAPISLNTRGDKVKNLHLQLKELGFVLPSNETADGIFGVGTRDALRQFQAKHSLDRTGELDESTGHALATDFRDITSPNRVEGRIFLENGLPATSLKIRIINKGFGGKGQEILGEIETDEQGFYSLSHNTAGANLEVRTVTNDTPLSNPKVVTDRNTVMYLVAPSDVVKPQSSEFTLMSDNLAKVLKVPVTELTKELSTAQENKDRQDLSFLHQSTGWDARLIATAATAAKASGVTNIEPTALYGAIRAGLPADVETLAQVSPEAFAVALKRANDAGVISLDDAQIDTAQEQFKSFANDKRSKIIAPGAVSSLDDMINSSDIEASHKELFKNLVLAHTGDDSTLWTKAKAEGIPDGQINSLQLQGKLAYLTLNNASLTELLQTEITSQDNLTRLVEKDLYRRDEWKNRLTGLAGDDPATRDANLSKLIPPAYTQENVTDRLDAYAEDLAQKVRRSFPTHTVRRMIEKDELKLGAQHDEMKAPVQKQATSRQSVLDGTPQTTWYVYDGSGQRVRKITENQAAGEADATRKSQRIYVGGIEIYREYGIADAVTLERKTYHVMDDTRRIAMIETRTKGMDDAPARLVRYQFANHLGSASIETDHNARVISYEEYHPFGTTSYQAVDKDIKAAAKRYRYIGMERDEESGFAYHSARYYLPWLGRWLNADPNGVRDGVNIYAYCVNDPINKFDVNGKERCWNIFAGDCELDTPRIFGGLKMVGGALETAAGGALVGVGAATSEIGIGIPIMAAGVFVTAHGVDTTVSGARTMWRGEAVDTFTSSVLLQDGLNVSRNWANGVDGVISMIGTFGAGALTRAPGVVAAPAEGLVHMTTAERAAIINTTQTLGKGSSTIYAATPSLANASTPAAVLRTGLMPSQITTAVEISPTAAAAFRSPAVIGPMTAWQRASGAYYSAGAGSVNLTTGVFTRSGPAFNQIFIYGVDVATTSALQLAPALASDSSQNSETSSAAVSSAAQLPDPADFQNFYDFSVAAGTLYSDEYLVDVWSATHGMVSGY